MSNSINLSLPDELRAFIQENSGHGTPFATPSEFVREVLRRHKEQQESVEVRDAIIDGYRDAIANRTHEFKGDLTALLKRSQ